MSGKFERTKPSQNRGLPLLVADTVRSPVDLREKIAIEVEDACRECAQFDGGGASGIAGRAADRILTLLAPRDEGWRREYERLRDEFGEAHAICQRGLRSGAREVATQVTRAALDAHVLGEQP